MLYRKYRPQNFDEVLGQEIIVKTLKNAIKNKRVVHGYLFAGQRGTGKTSVARIFAKALNCFNLKKEINPCNQCDNCQLINKAQFIDLIEIDAASNRGIDEIRALKESVNFPPIKGKYKVFIIDEAHQLTEPAFNALLKTLEEPPNWVIFILATTSPEKVPLTILSRVQRFDFRPIPVELIVQKLKKIAQQENISITDSALEMIAEEAQGAFRDAESILERVITAFNPEKEITQELLEVFFNRAGILKVLEFLFALVEKNHQKALAILDQIYRQGLDLLGFNKDVLKILRILFLWKTQPDLAKILEKDFLPDVWGKIYQLKEKTDLNQIKKYLISFLESEARLKRTPPIAVLPLEIAVLESLE